MPTPKLTPEVITAAIEGFEMQEKRIDAQIADLRQALSGAHTEAVATSEATPRKRRKFSAAARRRMKEAQQSRWAKIRGESEPPAPATPKPPTAKRQISKEGMARIIAATKKRWAAFRAAKEASVQPTPKKAARKVAKKKTTIKKPAVRAPSAKVEKKTAAVSA